VDELKDAEEAMDGAETHQASLIQRLQNAEAAIKGAENQQASLVAENAAKTKRLLFETEQKFVAQMREQQVYWSAEMQVSKYTTERLIVQLPFDAGEESVNSRNPTTSAAREKQTRARSKGGRTKLHDKAGKVKAGHGGNAGKDSGTIQFRRIGLS
jgi:K+-sensing histidine kinase KdpD